MSRDVASTIGARVVIVLAGLVTGVVTARVLGPEGRGAYFLAVTLAGFVVQFGNLGLPSANTYLVAGEPRRLPVLAVNSCWVSVAVLLLSGGAFWIVSLATDADIGVLVLAACLGAANLLFLLTSNLLVGVGRIGAFNATQIAGNCLALAGVLAAAVLAGSVVSFLLSGVAAVGIAAAAVLLLLLRGRQASPTFDLGVFREGIVYSLRAYGVTILGFIVLRGNVFIVQWLSPAEQLGVYSVAVQIADVIGILPVSMALVLFPALVRQEEARYRSMQQQLRIAALLMLAACIGSAALVRPAVDLAFGPEYATASSVYLAMVPGVFFLGMSTIISQYLGAVGLPVSIFVAWLMTVATGTTAALLMVPRLDALGAGLATSMAYGALFVMIRLAALRHHRATDPSAALNR